MVRLRDLADAAPPTRDRYVDLLRALSISVVVVAHWIAVVITDVDGELQGSNLLALQDWTHWATWLLQVMPLFFFVGGYAAAASLRSSGGGGAEWVLNRMERLLRPTTVLVVVLVAAAVVGALLDLPLVATAVWAAAIPLWFLIVYVSVVAVTPTMFAFHERFGVRVVIVLVVAVGVLDLVRLGLGLPVIGQANHLLAWVAIYQVGFMWRDGQLEGRAVRSGLVGLGGLALVVLTTAGPYPVSMVGVPGEPVQNTGPPTLALLALATTQIGIALFLAPAGRRKLARPALWTAVVAVNLVALTVFLWHMSAAVIAAALVYPSDLLPDAPPASMQWWILRLPWLAVVALVLTLLLIPLARVEVRARRPIQARRGSTASAFIAAGVVAVLIGLLTFPLTGPDDGVTGRLVGLVAYGVGLFLLRSATLRPVSTTAAR